MVRNLLFSFCGYSPTILKTVPVQSLENTNFLVTANTTDDTRCVYT